MDMIATSMEKKLPKQVLVLLVTVIIAGVSTFFLTRPAATATSFTPLSGLITLKEMASKAVPYEVAIANHKPTLIEFYADWCTTCQGMSPTVEALHQQYSEQVNFVMLNIDQPEWANQVADYGASGVPQFTLLDSTQTEIKTWVGKVPKPIFREKLDQVLG